MNKAPQREDYADALEWARDFEAYTTTARASSSVQILKENVLAILVCAPVDMPLTEVESEVNRIHPTGINSNWGLSATRTFSDVPSNTAPCGKDPQRVHYYMTC